MPKLIDITGERFDRWTVVRRVYPDTEGTYWECRCDCGTVRSVRSQSLIRGTSGSCGCLHSEIVSAMNTKHNHRGKRSYTAWQNMLTRVRNPNRKQYHNYGGRRISVCSRWLEYENFFEDMGHCPDGMSLDRIDNNGNYIPSNCRWATQKQQMNNMSKNKFITYQGKTMTVAAWADKTGIKRPTLYARVARGWEADKVLTPVPRRLT